MLRRFAFTVYDEPKPLGRARVNTKTGHFYTTSKDQNARFYIRAQFLSLPEVVADPFADGDGFKPLRGPLRLTVTAWLSQPKSIPKKRRGTALPSRRPDLDNYVKQVTDALQKYAFLDDAQIVTIVARKRYVGTLTDSGFMPGFVTNRITNPCWEICLEEIEE